MIDLVGALTISLMLEITALSIALLISLYMLMVKALKGSGSLAAIKQNIKSEISKKILNGADYSLIDKTVIVLYGIIRLTAIWWFTILMSVLLNFNIVQTVILMIIEMMFIGISVHNKITTNEEKYINYAWFKDKFDVVLKKANQVLKTRVEK